MTHETYLDIRPISGALGAEIGGVDLASPPSPAVADALRNALLAHKVVVFRDQSLTPAQLLDTVAVFGEPDLYPFLQGLPDCPKVIEILKLEGDAKNFGGAWHSDTSYFETPAGATLLLALETPSAGGDTLFADAGRAYDALSPAMRRMLDGLVAHNNSDHGYAGGRAAGMARLDGMKSAFVAESGGYEACHPVVRTHPGTGARSLYVNSSHTVRFAGMSEAESKPLIDFLCAQIVRPEFTCRVRWSPGTLTVWDNRAVQHKAINDYAGQRRRMHRVTTRGERPC